MAAQTPTKFRLIVIEGDMFHVCMGASITSLYSGEGDVVKFWPTTSTPEDARQRERIMRAVVNALSQPDINILFVHRPSSLGLPNVSDRTWHVNGTYRQRRDSVEVVEVVEVDPRDITIQAEMRAGPRRESSTASGPATCTFDLPLDTREGPQAERSSASGPATCTFDLPLDMRAGPQAKRSSASGPATCTFDLRDAI